jgi:hypothetical protein
MARRLREDTSKGRGKRRGGGEEGTHPDERSPGEDVVLVGGEKDNASVGTDAGGFLELLEEAGAGGHCVVSNDLRGRCAELLLSGLHSIK